MAHVHSEDKIDYIFGELFRLCQEARRFKIITKGAIESVLANPPRDLYAITARELSRINRNLLVPVSVESIHDILKISRNYDKIVVETVKKPCASVGNGIHHHPYHYSKPVAGGI